MDNQKEMNMVAKTAGTSKGVGKVGVVKKAGRAARQVVTDAELADLKGQVEAIKKSQAVIEFTLDGKILCATAYSWTRNIV
jgi:hypothetical protein